MAGMATTFFLYAYSAVALRDLVSLLVLPLVWLLLFALAAAILLLALTIDLALAALLKPASCSRRGR